MPFKKWKQSILVIGSNLPLYIIFLLLWLYDYLLLTVSYSLSRAIDIF